MKNPVHIPEPNKREHATLRLLIVLGIVSMAFFISIFWDPKIIGNKFLYVLLVFSFLFACAKILHEWIHYFFIKKVAPPGDGTKFTVDIFTTFCPGEPYEMITETLLAIKNIKYPHETFLCDEANDPFLVAFCKEHGIHHVTRSIKINAKAGNINNALNIAKGEICVILDPDHVPVPEFLDPVIDHFNDPKIGFVQIVQAYKNNYESQIAKGAAQQTYQFYGPIMMAMNTFGTVQAIGANCTFRRTALDSIGGHAPGLAEDMNTAMHLHGKKWKSVYVPSILAEGLVPSTLSAYYLQQLKWSRGVFELLLTTYVKFFRKFTFLQKLHYLTIPMYYFFGFVYLINFLIPIISLFSNSVPVKIGLQTFLFAGIPFSASIILVRLYVQKWVSNEDERGFHAVGGLLAIGTWWVFLLGLVYTVIRKRVPYIPTPKDGKEESNWRLNIPNFVVIVISLLAIAYGLYYDFNPYTLFMALLAFINCLILGFTIIISRENNFRRKGVSSNLVEKSITEIKNLKGRFWQFRRRLYTFFRTFPIPLLFFLLGVSVYFVNLYNDEKEQAIITQVNEKKDQVLSGIFYPAVNNGLTIVSSLPAKNSPYNLVSFYIPWSDSSDKLAPLFDSVYKVNSVPLITWEPWPFLNSGVDKDNRLFKDVIAGKYDGYLASFSNWIKGLNKPVYLRFAHEPDNPSYPWSPAHGNTPEDFKAGWKYVFNFFKNNDVNNVVWVWNPWSAKNIEAFFPGFDYVDWLSVNILNYRNFNVDRGSYSFEQLYNAYRQNRIFQSGLPVLISELGSLGTPEQKVNWLDSALHLIANNYYEIKGYVFFNSGVDVNTPDKSSAVLDWKMPNNYLNKMAATYRNDWQSRKIDFNLWNDPKRNINKDFRDLRFDTIRGVNYARASNWQNSLAPILYSDIEDDFKEMKRMGINTVKFADAGIYNYNLLKAAEKTGLNVIFTIYLDKNTDYTDARDTRSLLDKITNQIKKFRNKKFIKAWSVKSDLFSSFESNFYKPVVFYERSSYLAFYKRLLDEIKKIDGTRPVSLDVANTNNLHNDLNSFANSKLDFDMIGLELSKAATPYPSNLGYPFYFSGAPVDSLIGINELQRGVIVANWSDSEYWNDINFSGIKDLEGNKKPSYFLLENMWGDKGSKPINLPRIKILKPATTTFPGDNLKYHVLVFDSIAKKWVIPKKRVGIKYDWYLIKRDKWGFFTSRSFLGSGNSVIIQIPENPENYSILLGAVKHKYVSYYFDDLTTPLYDIKMLYGQ